VGVLCEGGAWQYLAFPRGRCWFFLLAGVRVSRAVLFCPSLSPRKAGNHVLTLGPWPGILLDNQVEAVSGSRAGRRVKC